MENQLTQLADWISRSGHTVFFGGAGVSTESGIPDFRSSTGLYTAKSTYGYTPEELLSHTAFLREPALFFRYYKENLVAPCAKPNAAHLALAAWEQEGLVQTVITQNIDGLHQAAGSKHVLELHGSNHRHYCMQCKERYPLDYILEEAHCAGGIPLCRTCGGTVRPDVVLYEEGLDETVLAAAMQVLSEAQLLLVGGTSLSVYPAAGLLRYFHGEHLVLINQSETAYDGEANLVICEQIGTVLQNVRKRMQNEE